MNNDPENGTAAVIIISSKRQVKGIFCSNWLKVCGSL